jgi:hypothetical protein
MSNPLANADTQISLLIVAPDPDPTHGSFLSALQPLVDHKNATGMSALAISISSITSHSSFFASGAVDEVADDAEAIKLAIKYAYETLATRYVMLVGDAERFPVRFWFANHSVVPCYPHTKTPIACEPDGTFIQSDLYYASLYHHSGTFPNMVAGKFDTWDQSGSGLYNQSYMETGKTEKNPDHVDGYPDLAVGRVPASTPFEVSAFVKKVIEYETHHVGPSQPSLTMVHDEQYGFLEFSTGMAERLDAAGWPDAIRFLLIENYPSVLSLADFDQLRMIYRAEDGGGELRTCVLNQDATWSESHSTGYTSAKGPALAVFAATDNSPSLWMAFVVDSDSGQGQITVCSSSSHDLAAWTSTQPIGYVSNVSPALVTFADKLFVAFTNQGSFDLLVGESDNGQDWRPAVAVGEHTSCAAPALAAFTPKGASERQLWIAFVGENPDNEIYICSSLEPITADGWSQPSLVTAKASGTAPSLAVFDGQLWLAFAAREGSGDIYVCRSEDGKTWAQEVVPGMNSAATPTLAVLGDELWMGFIGYHTNELFTCSRARGESSKWSHRQSVGHRSSTAPAPFQSASPDIVTRAAGKSFWVSYIGHGGPEGWGRMELFSQADALLSRKARGLPLILAAACQTTLFMANLPWGQEFVDTAGNHRGPFVVDKDATSTGDGPVLYEGEQTASTQPRQEWGVGPEFAETAPPNQLQGKWSLPVDLPMPNVYNTPHTCIGRTWVIDSAPGGAIAYFGLHDVAVPGPDLEMEEYLLGSYLEVASNAPPPSSEEPGISPVLGDLYLQAQQSYWWKHQGDAADRHKGDYHSIPRLYLGWFVFFGDPSLRLPVISWDWGEDAGGGGGGFSTEPQPDQPKPGPHRM